MRPIWHIITSFILGIIIFFFTRSLIAGLAAFVVGVFIDLDHLIDYWILKPKRPFSIRDFLDCEKSDAQKKWIFLLLHGWEWAALLVVAAWLSGWNTLLIAIFLSVVLHLVLDTCYIIKATDFSPSVYFVVLRAIRGFKKKNFENVDKSKSIS